MQKPMTPSTLLPEFAAEHATSDSERSELAESFAKLSALCVTEDSGLERGRARLLAAVSESSERYRPLFGKLTQFFDLNADALRAVFTRAQNEQEWEPGPLPGVSLFHFDGGPALAGLDTGFVRLKKGMPFPRHQHVGSERVMILEGGYHDDSQHWHGPGDLHDMSDGTVHALHMNAEHDVLLAVILSGEIRVLDAPA
jgi:hypothetical protein